MEIEEKGGGTFEGINLTFCENPFPPIEESIEAARKELKKSNFYTEPYSMRLKEEISDYIDVPTDHIHINAGSELIIRQLFSIFGQKVHLLVPTWILLEKTAKEKTFTYLKEEKEFLINLSQVKIPKETTLMPIVNPNNPTGGIFNISDALWLVEEKPKTIFLIDEAFIEFGGKPAVDLPERYDNVIVTRTWCENISN
jgi:histidinol-phosphate aminotransferase